jgi:endonuclease-3
MTTGKSPKKKPTRKKTSRTTGTAPVPAATGKKGAPGAGTKSKRSPRRAVAAAAPTPAAKARARRIYKALLERYPDAHCELDFRTPHELLIAVILSAQSTDVAVNKLTPALFERFPTPADYAASSPAEIEPHIRTIGLFRNKAKAVHAAMTTIVETFDGAVPRTMEQLLTLRGVARKTANVVLGNAFGINEGVVVDTHVTRLAQRFGRTTHSDPAKIERDLMALYPRDCWTMLSHLLIFHGRRVCKARGGGCAEDAICRRYCSNAKAMAAEASTSGRTGRATARKAFRKTKKKSVAKRPRTGQATMGKRSGARRTPRST